MLPVLLALVAAALLVWWGWYSAGLIMSLPREPLGETPRSYGLSHDEVSFAAADGVVLKGWFVPSPQGAETTVVLCHGRGACRSSILPATRHLASRAGHNLLYFDFRNHGASGGDRNSLGRLESLDVVAALDWLAREKPKAARRIGVYGMSLGGSVAIVTAAGRPEVLAVAAESPFTSVRRTIKRFAWLFHNVPGWMVPYSLAWFRLRLGFDPEAWSPERFVARLAPRPLFILQGGGDVRMPPSEGEALHALAGEPKAIWTVPGADHGGLWEAAGREYEDRLQRFFDGALKP